MKFLEEPGLSRFNAYFRGLNVGDYFVHGGLEAYSCKLAGYDKKLSRSLESDVIAQLQLASPEAFSVSPVGPLTDSSSRKTLIYLILTLNHMFPDYDFSNLRAQNFAKEHSAMLVKNDIDRMLVETCKLWDASTGAPMAQALWVAIDEAIGLAECDCYSYKAQVDADPFSEVGNLWSFTYFFYNRKIKRILCFSCHATSRTTNEQGTDSDEEMMGFNDDNSDYDVNFAGDMDL